MIMAFIANQSRLARNFLKLNHMILFNPHNYFTASTNKALAVS